MAKETHDQKRKRKLAEERKRQQIRDNQSLAYTGNKYKTPALTSLWMHTEVGIHETDVIMDGKLLDQQAAAGIEQLIGLLRDGEAPAITVELELKEGGQSDLLIQNIRRNWANGFSSGNRPSKDQLIGVLRSILGTIQLMRNVGNGRGYLEHMARFLTQNLGVSVRLEKKDREPLPPPASLISLGTAWRDGHTPETRTAFLETADRLIQTGLGGLVIDDCQQLRLSWPTIPPEAAGDLIDVVRQARASLMSTG